MTAEALLVDLCGRGVVLAIQGDRGDRLTYDAPAGAMTPDLRALLLAHKGELLALLRRRELRRHVADLLRQARRTEGRPRDRPDRPRPADLAHALRDSWRERLAICIMDGGLDLEAAEKIAADELKELLVN